MKFSLKKTVSIVLSAAILSACAAIGVVNAFAAASDKAIIHLTYTNAVTKKTTEVATVESYKGEILEFSLTAKAKNPEISDFTGFNLRTYFNQQNDDTSCFYNNDFEDINMYSSFKSLEYTNEYYTDGTFGSKYRFGNTISNPGTFKVLPPAAENGDIASFFIYTACNPFNDGDFTTPVCIYKFTLKVKNGGESWVKFGAIEVNHAHNQGKKNEYTENNPDFLNFSVKLTPVKTVPHSITLNKTSASMGLGDTLNLKANVIPSNAQNSGLIWYSLDSSVASVSDSGKVTAKGYGNTEIVAETANGISASCKIYVLREGETAPTEPKTTAPPATTVAPTVKPTRPSPVAPTVKPTKPSPTAPIVNPTNPESTPPAQDTTNSPAPIAPTVPTAPTTEDPSENIIGDVDGDGIVNSRDRIVLTRFLAKWSGYSIDEKASDVNADDEVNAKDRIILTRYLAKWSGYPSLPHE